MGPAGPTTIQSMLCGQGKAGSKPAGVRSSRSGTEGQLGPNEVLEVEGKQKRMCASVSTKTHHVPMTSAVSVTDVLFVVASTLVQNVKKTLLKTSIVHLHMHQL